MRWVIHSETEFEASHALKAYKGEAEALHRHLWKVAIEAGAKKLNNEGYALDFHEVHRSLQLATNDLKGANLNHHPEIGSPTPSAERVAEVVAQRISPMIESLVGALLKVSVWEGPDNRVDLRVSPEQPMIS